MAEGFEKVHEGPDVYCVRVPDLTYRTGFTNCYAVVDEGEALVVDTGSSSPEAAHVLFSALRDIGARMDATSVFLTHLHADHAEQTALFPEGVRVFLGRPEARLSELAYDEHPARAFLARLVREGFSEADVEDCVRLRLGMAAFDPTRFETLFVEGGDELRVGRLRLLAVDSSGHTPGHRSLYHPESGLLICGDQVLSSMAPYIALYPDVDDRLGLFLKRLDSVARFEVRTALCSHGPAVMTDFAERARWTAERRSLRVEQAFAALCEHSGSTGADIAKGPQLAESPTDWGKMDPVARLCVAANGMALVDRLVVTGRARSFEGDDGVLRYVPALRD